MATGFLQHLIDPARRPPPVWTTLALFAGFYVLLLAAILLAGWVAVHLNPLALGSLVFKGTPSHVLTQVLILVLGFGAPLAALLIWRRVGEKCTVTSLVRVSGRWRPGLGLAAFVLMMGFVAGAVAAVLPGGPEVWLRADLGGTGDAPVGLAMLAVLAFGFCIQVGFEELLCRGWLVQRVGWHGSGWLVAGAASAALFTAMHATTSIEPAELVRVFILGAAFVYTVARTGGLEAAFGAHLGNNLAVGIVLSPAITGVEMPSPALELGLPLLQGFLLVGLVELWLRVVPDPPAAPERG